MATVAHPTDPDVRLAASQFIVSLGDDTDFLDGKSAIFGRVVEGFDVLEAINNAIVDDNGYPLVDIRIKHTAILDDPYPDPDGLLEPPESPAPSRAQLDTARLGEDDQNNIDNDPDADDEDKVAAAEKTRREREARAQALTLEMMGDLPFAEVKPPENVLFVCKLNPVTQDSDLELIFSRFGTILSCEVIRDRKTGDSLQYAFIEFEDKSACEAAYFKMQDVLIDDRRIHIDFSQSVSKLSDAWRSDTNAKRQKQARGRGGGWGGVRELEKWRKYRNEDDDDAEGDGRYGMVHNDDEIRGQHAQAFAEKEAATKQSEDKDTTATRPPRPDDRYNGSRGDRRDRGDRGDRRDRGGDRRDRYGDRDRGRDNRDNRDRDGGRDRDRERGRGRGRDNERHERRDGSRSRRDDRYRQDRYRDEKEKPRSDARSRSPRRDRDRGRDSGRDSGRDRRDGDRDRDRRQR